MADKYSTIQQHQPLRVPQGWGQQEKALVVQLDETFDDIYRRFGRLRIEDMGEKFRKRIEDDEGNIAEITLDVGSIEQRVETAEGNITTLTTDLGGIEGRVTTAEGDITALDLSVGSLTLSVANKYDKISGIAINANGIDITGAKYLKLESGGTLDINTNNFVIDSANRKMVSNDMTFDQNGITKSIGSGKKFIVGNYSAKDSNTIAGVFCDASTTLGNIRLLTSPSDSTKSTELILETYINPYGSTDMAKLYFGGTWTVPVFGKKGRPIVYTMGQNYCGRLSGDYNTDCALNLCVDPDFDPDMIGRTGYPGNPMKRVRVEYVASTGQLNISSIPYPMHFTSKVALDGDATVGTLTYSSLVQSSSRDIKHDIRDMGSQGEKIDALRPVTFVYDNDEQERTRTGLIYEDTEPVMPEICTRDEENKAINYVELIPVLLKEIQELRTRVAALEGG